MKKTVCEWYNALRESWGLETLDQDFYEYDDLVLEDFAFRTFSADMDSGNVAFLAGAFFEELKIQFSGELGSAISLQLKDQFDSINALTKNCTGGFVCRTLSDEFAGCILYSGLSSKKVAFLNALFVNQNYRGLGIARELLSRSISTLTEDGIQFFIINNSFVPKMLKSTLTDLGFEEKDFALGEHLVKKNFALGEHFCLKTFAYFKKKQYLRGHRHGIKPSHLESTFAFCGIFCQMRVFFRQA